MRWIPDIMQLRWNFLCAFTLVWLLCILGGCTDSTRSTPITPAFYYWQTTFSLSTAQQDYLNATACKKIYVKIADIGLESGSDAIIPYTRLQVVDTTGLFAFNVVPVVFITNEVFQRLDATRTGWLVDKIDSMLSSSRLPFSATSPKEFQVDCDWTSTTRESFFAFLTKLRRALPAHTLLSATIRLHQYKFPEKTGVPPVDRGILMCYNTGNIDDVLEENSILNLEEVRKYLVGAPKHYPMPLDLALPTFSWLLVYRDDELWKIIPGGHAQIASGLLEKGTFLSGHYLRPGDVIRRETISPALLKQVTQLASKADLASDATIAFFQLEASTPSNYPAALIREVCKTADSYREKK
jgi:hypothetical protein